VQAVLFGSVLLTAASFRVPVQAQDLRIGFIAPKTGIFAQLGTDMQNGFQMYLDEHKGELGGAKVTLIVEDDQGKPDIGVTKANKLILSDKVHMLVGGVLATTGYALAPVATREKMLYIGSIATADDLGQRDFENSPMVRPQRCLAARPSLGNGPEQGWKISHRGRLRSDTRPGGFQRLSVRRQIVRASGRRSFGTSGPTSDIERHRCHLRADGGADVPAIPQADPRGRLQKADPRRRHQLRRIHPAIDGRRGDRRRLLVHVQRGARHPEERGVREDVPRQIRQGLVLLFGGQLHHRPMDRRNDEKTRRQVSGAASLYKKTMQGIKLDAVRGPVSLDDRLTAVNNIYIKKVEKKKLFGYDKDELWNTVIKTYTNVSQFWTYDKDAFLKQPVYSRDFPPCKYCE
jgi:branched-chain amino acid transport system substrate-binding protein